MPNDDPKPDYDTPWKVAIEMFFPEFMRFFFPNICLEIDWHKACEFLDKDLEKVTRDAKIGRRYADKLVKIWLKTGESAWVLIHIEVQSSRETNFAERIYIYRHRIWEQYKKDVASLVILCDREPNYRPNQYKKEIWGCKLHFEFPIVKLLDYAKDWHKLNASRNPFAIMVMAQLKAREEDQQRKYWKFNLVKRLYECGYQKEHILELVRFLDWILVLPINLEKAFMQELEAFEKEKNMQYVTSIERISRQEGKQEGKREGKQESLREDIAEVLEVRFTPILDQANQLKLDEIKSILKEIRDHDFLKTLHRSAITTASVEAFLQSFEKQH